MKPENMAPVSRRELRRQDRRAMIMQVAAESFLQHGYAGTTMSGIACTLGGSKGTLWSYFASKEDLFAAVIDHATTAFRAHLSEILAEPCEDLRRTITRFCEGIMVKVTSAPAIALHRLVIGEAGRFPEMGRIFYERAPRQTHKLLAGFLEGAMKRGQLREDEPMQAARLLIGLCLCGCHQDLLTGMIDTAMPAMVEADVSRAVTVFMGAYAQTSDIMAVKPAE